MRWCCRAPPGPRVPTVVFEAGSAATRSTWASVQTRVAAFTRAVVYDRAGLGRSVPDSAGRTLDRMADDLNDLLDGLEPSSGFVQVGHSAGGPMVRLAASRRPDRVAGLVLVDPTDEAADLLFGMRFRVGEKIVIAVEWVLARVGIDRERVRPSSAMPERNSTSAVSAAKWPVPPAGLTIRLAAAVFALRRGVEPRTNSAPRIGAFFDPTDEAQAAGW